MLAFGPGPLLEPHQELMSSEQKTLYELVNVLRAEFVLRIYRLNDFGFRAVNQI